MMQLLFKDKLALLGLVIILCMVICAVFAPLLAPHDPRPTSLSQRLLPPGGDFPLGTDPLGRCTLSRLLFGARETLKYTLLVQAVVLLIGVPAGMIAGYYGGAADMLLMRLADIILAFPNIILAIAVAGILGPGLFNVMLALAVVSWVGYARVVRGMVLSLKEKEFILAARTCGSATGKILLKHMLPNVMPPVIVLATLNMGSLVLSISTLSFLGLGAQPPSPEWGAMINDARTFIDSEPRLMILPGLATALTVLGFNLLGDGIRDYLDPRGYTRHMGRKSPVMAARKGGAAGGSAEYAGFES